MFIDTHAHLNFPDFDNDLDQVIKDSIGNGVEKIICASSNLKDSQKAIELAQKYPGIIYALVGIHPQKTDPENQNSVKVQVQELEGLVLSEVEWIAGIGECGLDFSPAPPGEEDRNKEDQYYLFEEQVKLALKYNLPICVHSRKSSDETVTFLTKNYLSSGKKLRGVLHCYAAGKKNISKLLEIGFFFGLDGNLTYDEGLQNVVKEIPLEKIILETDSPFLSPSPFRGLRNEPKNVRLIAETIAKVKGIPFSKVEEQTTKNSIQIFKL